MENGIIYARFSSQSQNEQSIEAQIRICSEFAENKGIKIVNVYSDKAKTGTNTDRPAFQKMVSDAQTGAFRYIIVYMFDRFARNRRDSVMYKEILKEKYGIKVISALEPISEDEGGEFYEMFLEWNAEKYSKRLSKRIRDGIDTSIANGMFCGGKVPFGYRLEIEQAADNAKPVKKVVIYDEEAEIIRFIFTQYADGKTKKQIADILNEKGYRINGKRFKGRSFDNWMTNEKYTGEFKFGGRDCKNIYPAIVDKALFLKVQEKLAENKYVLGGQETAKVPYLLSGKVFCGHCGSEMVADKSTGKSGKKYSYYTCKKRQKHECDKLRENKDNLESYVTSCVVNFLKDKKNAEMAVDDVFAYYEKRTDEDNLRSITARIANIQNEAEKLADAFIDAKSQLLKNKIETKMAEYEILLSDLETQTALHTEYSENVKIIGRGLLDCGEVLGGDNKRKHVVNVGNASNVLIEGLTVINSNTWTICAYNSDKVRFDKNLLLSYRTYSDGLMFSDCINSSGRYNFVRTGDDAIEFKGTGWQGGSTSGTVGTNCVFEYNDCWTDKGSGYCLTWESECEMDGMAFRNNSVGFAQPVWTAGNNALDCRLGTNPNKTWQNVVFDNIEVYHCISYNVMHVQISEKGANLKNITFSNIKVYSTELCVYAFTMDFQATGGSIENIKLKNIDFCGRKLTAADIDDPTVIRFESGAKKYKNELTIE